MIFRRVRRRLLTLNALAMTVVIAVLAGGVILLMDNLLMLQEGWALEGDAHRIDPFDARRPSYGTDTFFIVWDANGDVLSNPNHVPTAPLRSQALAGQNGP
ncbi:MAG: hypothetical protein J2P45_32515, partial [Candidatus Dormibacteraeota bacterium]|nr:hypothetical protein [Candidatus Dormibacteraeota bacterium]